MIGALAGAFSKAISRIFPGPHVESLIVRLLEESGAGGHRTLVALYHNLGILNFENAKASGESWALNELLPVIAQNSRPVIFDVGANIGNYALEALEANPNAQLFAFEPGPAAFARMKERLSRTNAILRQTGIGEQEGRLELHLPQNAETSQHASAFPEALTTMLRYTATECVEAPVTTVDAVCEELGVEHIDFLKIDTEGYEKNVLLGARQMLSNNRISLIQFEFNEMNIAARASLKDFYDILKNYELFRLKPKSLLPLGQYDAIHEIYQFQNIVAIRQQDMEALMEKKLIDA